MPKEKNLLWTCIISTQKRTPNSSRSKDVIYRDIAAIIKKKEAAEVNDVGNGNGDSFLSSTLN
jgi:hypothetical protein